MMLAPIADHEVPVGEDLRLNANPTSSYQMLRDARTSARNYERSAMQSGEVNFVEKSHWTLILEKVPEVLAQESKDIEIVAWYIEALTRHYGFQGLAQGYALAGQLIKEYGSALYPQPDEDGLSTQLGPLVGLNGYGNEGALITPIKSICITEGNPPGPLAVWQCEQALEADRISDPNKKQARLKEGVLSKSELDTVVSETPTAFLIKVRDEISLALREYTGFQEIMDQYSEQEPQPTAQIMDALKTCRQMLTYVAGSRVDTEADSGEQTGEDVAASDDIDAVLDPSHEAQTVVQVLKAGIRSRQDAVEQLREVAEYYRKAEPHSPISYSIEQIIRWSNLSLPELIAELIPDEAARKKFQHLSGIQMQGNG